MILQGRETIKKQILQLKYHEKITCEGQRPEVVVVCIADELRRRINEARHRLQQHEEFIILKSVNALRMNLHLRLTYGTTDVRQVTFSALIIHC